MNRIEIEISAAGSVEFADHQVWFSVLIEACYLVIDTSSLLFSYFCFFFFVFML